MWNPRNRWKVWNTPFQKGQRLGTGANSDPKGFEHCTSSQPSFQIFLWEWQFQTFEFIGICRRAIGIVVSKILLIWKLRWYPQQPQRFIFTKAPHQTKPPRPSLEPSEPSPEPRWTCAHRSYGVGPTHPKTPFAYAVGEQTRIQLSHKRHLIWNEANVKWRSIYYVCMRYLRLRSPHPTRNLHQKQVAEHHGC